MKKLIVLAAAVTLLTLSPAIASTVEWDIDPPHSNVTFSVRHIGIIDQHGMFTKCAGTLQIDDEVISNSKVNATVDVTSVVTGVEQRDKHLQTADFFDAAKFPTMNFESTKIWKAPDGSLKMTGNLTIHGITKEVTFDILNFTAPVDIMNATRRGISAKTTIDRRDFGVTYDATVGNQVTIDLEIDAIKAGSLKTKPAAAPAAAPAAN